MTDEELFSLFRDGGRQDALTKLYRRYQAPLTRYISGKTKFDQLTCDEIIQQVFIRIVNNKDQFSSDKMLKPWIYTIADNLSQDFMRSASRRNRKHKLFSDYSNHSKNWNSDPADEMSHLRADESAENPDEKLADAELGQKAMQLLRRLPKEMRHSVQMLVLNGIPSRAAGPLMGVSHRQAQVRARMALDVLRKQLDSVVAEDNVPTDDECTTIRELVDALPDGEFEAVDRVIYQRDNFDDNDLAIFATFIRRLVGEAV